MDMADKNMILSADAEEKLLKPIDEYVGKIQAQIDELRVDGSDKVRSLKNHIAIAKEDKNLSKDEKDSIIAKDKAALEKAKAVEAANKDKVAKLIADAEGYLKEHYDSEYYSKVVASCEAEKAAENESYERVKATLKTEHEQTLAKLSDSEEIKDEKYVYKNKLFDAQMTHESRLQEIKDRKHDAFSHKYHLIDLLRMSKYTFMQSRAQKFENYKYTFNTTQFLYKNGLYIVIVLIFIALCIITPIVKNTQLLTVTNILNILQQASPRMFLALGVAGLILLTGTDLSIGRMVGMGMVTATIIMHNGANTGGVFGHIFDFSSMPVVGKALFALVACIILTTVFSSIAGFFMAKYKMHPFISTMANMLIIFGLVTYATKGVSFGAIDSAIPNMFIPTIGNFPTIIIWAIVAVVVVWFIWNKTTFGKNLYAVGGNPEAAAVSGISVFKVTLGAFILAGILYGFGSWLECNRMVGSGSAAYGQGWDMDAIAACVVGGVSFTGGIGKISGVVTGVLIFTSLTYSLTILGIDTNLQFIFEGIIILAAVTLDCLKYVQKK
jgi:methyl-galactoside transport system permease protein